MKSDPYLGASSLEHISPPNSCVEKNWMHRRSFLAIPAFLAAASLAGRSARAQQASITGAGGFLPKPLYDKWAQMAREGAGIQLT